MTKYNLPVDYTKLDWRKGETRAVREQYVLEQDGLCYWCKTDLNVAPEHTQWIRWKNFPPGFRKNPIHLQHCHKTDMTEGAVHMYCNAVMWQYHGR